MTDIIHFNNLSLEVFKGDYFAFERTVEERRKRQERAHAAQEMKRAHLQARQSLSQSGRQSGI